MRDPDDILELARHLADDVLFPVAHDVDIAAIAESEHCQRLLREAGFLLVFGSRPPIKASLLARLSSPSG